MSCEKHTPFSLVTQARDVAYHEDASALFAHLGGTEATDAILLESADIESKKNTNCLAIIRAALRVTCTHHDVQVDALTPVGQQMLARLVDDLADYVTSQSVTTAAFRFRASRKVNERDRLKDVSNIEVLRALQSRAGYQGENLPLLGGGFAFDYVASFEHLPAVADSTNTYPDYQFLVAEVLLQIDHLTRSARVECVATTKEEAHATLDNIAHNINEVRSCEPAPMAETNGTLTAIATITDADFRHHVGEMQKHIRRGDAYQVVPARAFTLDCPDAFTAYRQLRTMNPSPYMFYVRGFHNDRTYELFGASPESNLKFNADTREVQVYPIAGTRPRGLNPDGSINHELDIRAELDMRTDAKEIAEHTMLVDLARNDLARVAVPATRRVADLLQVDRYSRVMHLVSRVTATLHPDFDALDAYRACMNMGTLTGAPKLRAMELVREVEGTRRGSYGGAVGYLKGDGSMDTAIVIRAAFVDSGIATVQAGAGVVRDSNPQSEADETVHKAYAVLSALAAAANKKLEISRA
ncbi:MAG: anthranilate synthase component 1 [Corynebacterium sp.]|uniref:anthranilate synthase component 1 n=1 Tax=Corynebacterium sp. TaxID=1720 RepID=UPI0026DC6129|nr:anthranilate synthase component 1 [Corynebacterium sp.]MDO4761685.1 anthranilate synthase component 1 [Corynebacterium sp.]